MSRICANCSTEKADKHFRKAGRGLSRICIECTDGPFGPAAAAIETPEPVTITASLELPMGYGFRASIESGRFCIEQDATGADGEVRTDNITLAPHEARQLVDWLAAQVEREAA